MIKLMKYQFKSIYSPWKFSLLMICFLLSAMMSYLSYGVSSNQLLKKVAFAFYTPLDSKMDVLRCLMIIVPFIIIVGQFIEKETKTRTMYILFRIKDDVTYFKSLFLSCLLFIGLSLLGGYVVTVVFFSFIQGTTINDWSLVLPFFSSINALSLITHQFLLLFLSLALLTTTYVFLIFITNNSSLSLLILLSTLLGSIWISLANPEMIRYFPLIYGLMIFKELSQNSFLFFYGGLGISLVIMFFCTYQVFLFRRESLFLNEH